MTADTYLLSKALHILGAVIFLGNILVSAWRKTMAERTRDAAVIAFAQRQITLTDFVLTGGGAALLLVTGIGNAVLRDMDYWNVHWLAWGLSLFIASGLIWLLILIPIQFRQARMARTFDRNGPIPARYWTLGRAWIAFGIVATVLPLINLYWMVFKPA